MCLIGHNMCMCCKVVQSLYMICPCAESIRCPKRTIIIKDINRLCGVCFAANHNRLTPCVVRSTPVIAVFYYSNGRSLEDVVNEFFRQ
jgi:hypothetical protein